MRFDELVIKVQGDELRLRFHPELTVLCGLGTLERQSLVAQSVRDAQRPAEHRAIDRG